MKELEVRVGPTTPIYTATGKLSGFFVELQHVGLSEYAKVRDQDQYVLKNKVAAKLAAWSEKWARVSDKRSKESAVLVGKNGADEKTRMAEFEIASLRSVLSATLSVNDAVNWSSLEDHREFRWARSGEWDRLEFSETGEPRRIVKQAKPNRPAERARPTLMIGFLGRILPGVRKKREQAHAEVVASVVSNEQQAIRMWELECGRIDNENLVLEATLIEVKSLYETAKAEFQQQQTLVNLKIQDLKTRYLAKDPAAVIENCELVLAASKYPDIISKEFTVNFNPANGLLVIDYQLPARRALPTLSKVTFIQSRNELKEAHLPDTELNRMYDDLLYQIALRTIHEVFEADVADALKLVCFNGWVQDINPATGKTESGCLLSVQAGKDQFSDIDLARIDPKACFKQLKGVAAAKLSGMTPIRPLVQLDTNDPRFVAGYEVANSLNAGVNLAAMGWEDFEHLIREIFEQEFATSGGEVKVTRGSSDGGVDAVAFDPDPIRGGKTVIQAKRYTNTVGVAAVRDLYGTVMNEGANKGILVTTSDYGPDAYAFAAGKPITLLNGSNLLYMLGKHGHTARIDIKEAKAFFDEQLKNR